MGGGPSPPRSRFSDYGEAHIAKTASVFVPLTRAVAPQLLAGEPSVPPGLDEMTASVGPGEATNAPPPTTVSLALHADEPKKVPVPSV